jgi:hypothetical protein
MSALSSVPVHSFADSKDISVPPVMVLTQKGISRRFSVLNRIYYELSFAKSRI